LNSPPPVGVVAPDPVGAPKENPPAAGAAFEGAPKGDAGGAAPLVDAPNEKDGGAA